MMFKLNFTSHFQTYLLSTFIVLKFLKFCNHLTINSKKSTMLLMCYFYNYFQSTFFYLYKKTRPFFDYLFLTPCFYIFYHVFTQLATIIIHWQNNYMDYACHFLAFTQLEVNEQLLNGHLKSHRRLFPKE